MESEAIIRRLAAFPEALGAAVGAVTPEEAGWKPASGAWSILEIVCHLVDEERDDFRMRVRLTLEDRAAAWPPIDPEGWARTRGYSARDLGTMTAEFARERAASIAWLRALPGGPAKTDWSVAHAHPKFGPIRAGDLLASWAAHDALHLRQIAKRLFEIAGRDAGACSTRYAGDWGP